MQAMHSNDGPDPTSRQATTHECTSVLDCTHPSLHVDAEELDVLQHDKFVANIRSGGFEDLQLQRPARDYTVSYSTQ